MDEINFPIIGSENKLPVYLVGVGSHVNQRPIDRPSGFPFFQFIYCTGGSGILHVGDSKRRITCQQGFFLYPNEPHEYYATDEPWGTHWITFDGTDVKPFVQALGFTKSKAFYLRDFISVESIWGQMIIEAKSHNIERGDNCSALIYRFLILLKNMVSDESPNLNDNKLSQFYMVLSYIDEHFDCIFTLDELTEKINVSPQYLCKLFKKHLNLRPFEYVTKRRIQAAKSMLIKNDLTEADIAERCGFNSLSYFCAVFKRCEKITPAQFRGLHSS
jgi:AraC family transcriptional regulator, arabinose operon regulatory protein